MVNIPAITMPKSCFFMGIDASLTGTGICVINEAAEIVEHMTIDPGTRTGPERLYFIEGVLSIELRTHRPQEVAIEGYGFGSMGRIVRIGELGGVLRLMLWRLKIPYVEVAPMSLKKFITGKGAGDKNLILLAVYKKWGISCTDDDQADAYGLARVLHTYRFGKPLSYEQEVCNKVFGVTPAVKLTGKGD